MRASKGKSLGASVSVFNTQNTNNKAYVTLFCEIKLFARDLRASAKRATTAPKKMIVCTNTKTGCERVAKTIADDAKAMACKASVVHLESVRANLDTTVMASERIASVLK